MNKIIFQFVGTVEDAGRNFLGKLQIKTSAPVDLGRVGFKVRFDRTGNRYIQDVLKRKFGEESFRKQKYGLLQNKRITLVVE